MAVCLGEGEKKKAFVGERRDGSVQKVRAQKFSQTPEKEGKKLCAEDQNSKWMYGENWMDPKIGQFECFSPVCCKCISIL